MLVKQKQKMTYKSTVAKIAFLRPYIALVHTSLEWPRFTSPSAEEVKDFNGTITMVMVKQDGQWLIRALQNTITGRPPIQEQLKK